MRSVSDETPRFYTPFAFALCLHVLTQSLVSSLFILSPTEEWVEDLPEDDLKNRVIFGGPCILVEGEDLAKAEGKL